MAQIRTSRVFDVIFLLVLVVLLMWAAANRVGIGDWIYFMSYEPDSKTRQVAADAGLSETGKQLFYRTNPHFTNMEKIAAECDIERLGCINEEGDVFILDEPNKHDQTVVTAAHEMLHMAYRRLSESQKEDLAPLLDEAIKTNAINGLDEELRNITEIEDRHDEAHSFLGSEYKDLPIGLAEHYKRYFSDRSKVVAAEARSQLSP